MSSLTVQRQPALDVAQWRGPVIGAGILAALLLFTFWHFFVQQVRFAIDKPSDWGHTLVIPFIAAYFVYLRRDDLIRRPFRTTWIGLVPLVLGIGVYMVSNFGPKTLNHHNLHGAGVSLTVLGLALLFFGFRAMSILWFPIAYLCVFGQTISQKLMNYATVPMQRWTAIGSEFLMRVMGFDIERSATTLTLHSGGEVIPLNIAEACSGMRMLMAFLALGVAMAYTGLRHPWQRVALVLMAVPTAIFVNVLRVVTLAFFSLADTSFASGDFHTFIGLVWLVPAFLIYLGVMWVLRQMVVDEEPAVNAPPEPPEPPEAAEMASPSAAMAR